MKHITKFVEFLNENQEWSKEDLEDFLLPFKDLNMVIDIDKSEITNGEFEGREVTSISFSLQDFKKIKYSTVGIDIPAFSIYDERIWDFFDEISTLKRRLESDKVFIHMTTHSIVISYLHSELDKDSKLYRVKKLRNQIKSAILNSKSDFSYNTTTDVKDDKIIVDCSAFYTTRKWNNLTRGIDFSDFNLEFDEYNSSSIYNGCKITISLK